MDLIEKLPELSSGDFTSIILWVTLWAVGLVILVMPTGMYLWLSWQQTIERADWIRQLDANREMLNEFMRMQTSANIRLADALSALSKKRKKAG